MIKLLILGPSGAMGKLLSQLALEDDNIDVVAACDKSSIGESLGFLAGTIDKGNILITDVNQLGYIIDETKPEVVVDFTIAGATEKNCMICVKKGVRCVIGTTALSSSFLTEFEASVKQCDAPAVISPNMATGMNVIFKIAAVLSEYLSDWDIEVIELHHHRKVDVPSGTALTIANKICDTLGCDPEETLKFGRSIGPNKRKIGAKNEIGVHAIRGGDIIGDHTVLYAGPGERIELKHQAQSRTCFAEGAIKAIKFIANAKENKIYATNEVLGI
ncbi:MAG: 4-hydroxy-tetrahydrodipicolinate reductase [Candidatus Lokiarchaeota archaeon]|nr:4-hydroxy-tetrahydrodipicolinate reductase [Candidatus Lokiarchaeota archaeon]